MTTRILIAEDKALIADFLEKGLRSHGFTTGVASNAQQAIALVHHRNWDLLILDLGLPDQDGMQVLEELRGQGNTLPIIILTARDDIQDKLAGLEGGADDYMTKPFEFAELLARIRLRLRQASSQVGGQKMLLTVRNIVLDLRGRTLKVGDRSIELAAREFALAEILFRQPGKVLSRQELLDKVWGYNYDPGSNIVDVYVRYLRKKLDTDAIETVRGVGYRLNP
jgi:DNA-binding response OmpR family regulator